MNTIIDELREIQVQENYQYIEACIEIVKKYKDIYNKGLAYDQVSWERDIAFEQLKELGGEFGEDTALIRHDIIYDFADYISNYFDNKSLYCNPDGLIKMYREYKGKNTIDV